MADLVSDQAVQDAYEQVRKNPDVKYAIFGYADKNKLKLDGTGGDVAEGVARFDDNEVQYGYFKVKYQNVDGVFREKFVFVSWIGPQVKGILVKTRPSTHLSAIVQNLVKDVSVTLSAPERSALTEQNFIEEVKRVNF